MTDVRQKTSMGTTGEGIYAAEIQSIAEKKLIATAAKNCSCERTAAARMVSAS